VPALAVVALGDVESDRAERRTELLAEVAIVPPDPLDDGTKDLDGPNRELEDMKGVRRSCLHAPPAKEP
jgi:hypothetical protein